jgi:predicted MFS family arabinose efflux permease
VSNATHVTTQKAWTFVIVLTAATVISFVHRYLPSVLIDAIRRDVAITDLQFTTLQSAFALTYAGATLLSGWFSDRGNRRNIIVGGIATWTVGTAVFGSANDLSGLLAGRVLVGLGEAVLVPAGVALLCEFVTAERRGREIARTSFGATLATSLSFSGGGWMLAHAQAGGFKALPVVGGLSDWRQVVMLLAATGIVLIPILLTFPEPPRSTPPGTAKARFGDLMQLRGKLWLVLFAGSSIAVADFAYTSWQTALLTRSYGWDIASAGQALGLTALISGTAAAWAGGYLADRMHAARGPRGRILLLQICAAGLALSSLLLLVPTGGGGVAAFAVWQTIANVAYVAVAVTLQDIVTDRTRALAASMSVCLSIGIGLGFGPSSIAALNALIGQGANALPVSLFLFVGVLGIITLVLASALAHRLKPFLSKSENSA